MKLENVADKNFFRFTNLALKRAVNSQILIQVKGVGANGSFKLAIKDKHKKPVPLISKKIYEINRKNRKPIKTVVSIKKSAIKQASRTKSTPGKKTSKKTIDGKKARALVKKVTKIKKIK